MTSETGKNCLACHQPIAEEELLLCGECQAPYHRLCWQRQGGCSMPGCAANPRSSAGVITAPPGSLPTKPERTSPLAIASLVLGILGFLGSIKP